MYAFSFSVECQLGGPANEESYTPICAKNSKHCDLVGFIILFYPYKTGLPSIYFCSFRGPHWKAVYAEEGYPL